MSTNTGGSLDSWRRPKYLLNVDAVASAAENQRGTHSLGESPCLRSWSAGRESCTLIKSPYLVGDFLLLFPREIDEVIVLGANQNRDRCLVEPPSLAIPLLDAVERAFPGQVKHEQNRHGIIADEREHVDELSLAAEIPYAERYFRVADADCLFHEVDAQRLDVVLIPAALDVLHHQGCFADLCIAYHAYLDDNLVARAGLVGTVAAPVAMRSVSITTGTREAGWRS